MSPILSSSGYSFGQGTTFPKIVTNGLQLYLDAGNPLSYPGTGVSWKDLSGKGNNFTMQGTVTYSAGEFTVTTGQIANYFFRNPFTHPTSELTMELWCLTTSPQGTGHCIWSYASSGNGNEQKLNAPENLSLDGPDGVERPSGISVVDGRWKQLVRTANRVTGEDILYINGVEVYRISNINSGILYDSTGSFILGQEQDSVGGSLDPNQAFDGKYSIFRMYDRVLTLQEIQQNYNANTSRYSVDLSGSYNIVTSGLVLYYDVTKLSSYDANENLRINSNTGGFKIVVGSWASAATSTNIIAPNDSSTTYRVVTSNPPGGGAIDIAYQDIALTPGVTYTVSAHYYATGGTEFSRTIGIQYFGNGSAITSFTLPQNTWVRRSLTFIAGPPAGGGGSAPPTFEQVRIISNDVGGFASTIGAEVYLWGAQVERSSSANPYYSTGGSPKERGTTLTDLSGNGYTGTFTNMDGTNFSSANGGYLTFDGTNEYITSTFSTTSGQAVTYAGWLYSTETTTTNRTFVDSVVSSVSTNPKIQWNTSGQIQFDGGLYTTTTVYRNQWVYVALSKPSGSSSASYYVNGVLVGSGTAYTTPTSTPTWFRSVSTSANTWKGNASKIQAYNRALTSEEILQNFNADRIIYSV